MNAYRSTTLKLFSENCPKALDHYEKGTEYDREIFATGTAAHACLQVISQRQHELGRELDMDEARATTDGVVHVLSTEGRAFDGVPEPPMPFDRAAEGQDIALARHFWEPAPAGFRPEVGLGMNSKGEACAYDDPDVRWKALLDGIGRFDVEDEEDDYTLLRLLEYKTAWPTNADELETTQTQGQAVLAWLHNPDVDAIERNVVNLRTGKTFTDTVYLNGPDVDRLQKWLVRILGMCRAADVDRKAAPGANCLGCQYAPSCTEAWHVALPDEEDDSREAIGQRFAVLDALRTEFGKLARAHAKEDGIPVPGGFVGYQRRMMLGPAGDAVDGIVEEWFNLRCDDAESAVPITEVRGLLAALDLGKGNIERMFKVLMPSRKEAAVRREAIAGLLAETPSARWGTWKEDEE